MLFKKKQKVLCAFTAGTIVPITEVPDEVFSTKMMGDGLAIQPTGNTISAPCNGTITAVMDTTEHAVGITLDDGMEILLHVGLDTVNLTTKIFTTHVHMGDRVTLGETLITYNKEELLSQGYSDITMLVILNNGTNKNITIIDKGNVTVADEIVIYN